MNTEAQQVADSFTDLYHPNLTTDDIGYHGLMVRDRNNRTVGVAYGEIREGMIHTTQPYAEIMVIGLKNGILAGWVHRDSMIDAGDRSMVPVKSLNKMPDILNFASDCPHMSVYGGYYDDDEENWICFGCNKVLVFSDGQKL
jgi:hypothetical protein